MLEIIQIPLLSDNYSYVLHDPESGETAVVDPSSSLPILELLDEKGWKLSYIFNTHHHFDHTGGNEDIKAATKCKIVSSHTDRERIPGGADITLNEGDEISVGASNARIMEIPGHTIGDIAFYFEAEQALFSGDALFSLGCGKMFEGNPEQMWNSLRRMADLPRSTKLYCGHEYTQANGQFALVVDPHNDALKSYLHQVDNLRREGKSTVPSTIEIEVAANPFLRAPAIVTESGELGPAPSPHEAFAHLRAKKDQFVPSAG